jgi:hypothetical protein
MAVKQAPFVLGDVNAEMPGDVFAYRRGDAPGSAPMARNRLRNATPRGLEAWLVRKRIKTTTASVFVVQLCPFDRSVIGTVEYKVTGGKVREVKRARPRGK